MLNDITTEMLHELNQPLTVIVNRCAASINRIDAGNPDLEKIKEAFIKIEEQAFRSVEIIKQLREVAKDKENNL